MGCSGAKNMELPTGMSECPSRLNAQSGRILVRKVGPRISCSQTNSDLSLES